MATEKEILLEKAVSSAFLQGIVSLADKFMGGPYSLDSVSWWRKDATITFVRDGWGHAGPVKVTVTISTAMMETNEL